MVLIIGILAAIALPMYNRSVERTRASQALITGRAFFDSAKRYYLEAGSYPMDFSLLDISQNFTSEGNTGTGRIGWFTKDWNVYLTTGGVLLDRLDMANYRYTILWCYDGTVWCGAGLAGYGNLAKEQVLCASLGGKLGVAKPAACNTSRSVNYLLP